MASRELKAPATLVERVFPSDFDGAPVPPEQGEYRVTWYVQEELIRRQVVTDTFKYEDVVGRSPKQSGHA